MMNQEYKIELHAHTNFDPRDAIDYSAYDLINLAASHGYQALAITCHDALQWSEGLRQYASERGINLIPGVEATVEGYHVLIYGLKHYRPPMSFQQLRALRRAHPELLVVAPHPFFPGKNCLRGKLWEYRDCFDALEYSHFYSRQMNFNRRAEKFARQHGKALLGTSDCHMPDQMNKTFALVSASSNDFSSLVAAIREDRVRLVSSPFTHFELLRIFLTMVKISSLGRWLRIRARLADWQRFFSPQSEE
jgi:predicted metal-dependent phosphoesterase TrpH